MVSHSYLNQDVMDLNAAISLLEDWDLFLLRGSS